MKEKTIMSVWTSWNNKKEIDKSLAEIKHKIKKFRRTKNRDGVWILWIDSESAEKYKVGK